MINSFEDFMKTYSPKYYEEHKFDNKTPREIGEILAEELITMLRKDFDGKDMLVE